MDPHGIGAMTMALANVVFALLLVAVSWWVTVRVLEWSLGKRHTSRLAVARHWREHVR